MQNHGSLPQRSLVKAYLDLTESEKVRVRQHLKSNSTNLLILELGNKVQDGKDSPDIPQSVCD